MLTKQEEKEEALRIKEEKKMEKKLKKKLIKVCYMMDEKFTIFSGIDHIVSVKMVVYLCSC